jgi:hypothetical protein
VEAEELLAALALDTGNELSMTALIVSAKPIALRRTKPVAMGTTSRFV